MERNYQNGKICCIRKNIDDDIYVGSTTQTLSKRMAKHRGEINCKKSFNYKIYVRMRELGVENFYIELLEEYSCENVEQLRKREGEFIRQIGTLNARIECRSKKEYNDDFRLLRPEYSKQYCTDHKETIRKQNKNYYEEHKDEAREYSKQYYIEPKHNLTQKKETVL